MAISVAIVPLFGLSKSTRLDIEAKLATEDRDLQKNSIKPQNYGKVLGTTLIKRNMWQ
jgi:hypothetical protein